MQAAGIILIALVSALQFGCSATAVQENSVVGFFFDTVITITAYCQPDTLDGALLCCGEYEKLLSKTIEGSDVWRINHATGGETEVSADTIALLTKAMEISEASGGAFDVSVAPASALWDFTGDVHTLPDKDALAAAAALIDYRKIIIHGNRVILGDGMEIDLGGIAKGYIADKVAQLLREQGVEERPAKFRRKCTGYWNQAE